MPGQIAIFLPSLDPGGAETSMLLLAESFKNAGHECEIVVARGGGTLETSLPPGIQLVTLGQNRPILGIFCLAKYLRQERPSVLLSTVFAANNAALMASLLSARAVPVVICEASLADKLIRGPNRIRTILNLLATRFFYRFAAVIIAVSEGVKESLRDIGVAGWQDIVVIPNPIRMSFWMGKRPQARRAGVGRVVACGRLETPKDYPTLLRAFAQVEWSPLPTLTIVGGGSLLGDLQALAVDLGIQDRVEFVGYLSNPSDLMSSADVFVHTACYEGFGNVLVEALACGCPIVATDCPGGIRDALAGGKFGKLVPVGDFEAVARGIEAGLGGGLALEDPASHLETFLPSRVSFAYLACLNRASRFGLRPKK